MLPGIGGRPLRTAARDFVERGLGSGLVPTLRGRAEIRSFKGAAARIILLGVLGTASASSIGGEFRRVNGPVVDNGGDAYTDGLGRGWIRDAPGYRRPEWFDEDVPKAAVSSSAIAACFAVGPTVFTSGLTYLIDTASVVIPVNGLRLKGEEGHTLRCTMSGTAFKTAFFTSTRGQDIRIDNINAVNVPITTADYDRHLFQGKSVSRVYMDGNKVTNCAHAFFGSDTETYGVPDDPAAYARIITDESNAGFNQSRDVHVSNWRVIGNRANRLLVGEANYFRYCVRWSSTGYSHAQDCYYAVKFWGGDSGNAEGAVGNERKCTSGTVELVHSLRTVASSWGSMGDNITMHACNGLDGTDVGLDWEGCTNCKSSSCTMSGFANGNFAFFHNNLNCFNSSITSIQASASAPHARVYNASGDGSKNRLIGFKGGSVTTLGTIGIFGDSAGPASELSITNLQLLNTALVLNSPNKENLKVLDNDLLFTIPAGGAFTALQITGASGRGCKASGNTIHSAVNQPAGSIGGDTVNTDGNFAPVYDLFDNTSTGFPIDWRYGCTSANAGLPGIFRVNRNTFGTGTFAYLNPSRVQFRSWEDNLNGSATTIPTPVLS